MQRLALQPGEMKRVTFTLPAEHLGFYDEAKQFVVEPGTFKVMVGGSAAHIHLTDAFDVGEA